MKKINEAKKVISLNDKLLGYLLSRFEIIISKDFGKTAATNGNVILINPLFLKTLTINEVSFILLHELLHITLDHLKRIGMRNIKKYNIAADIVVNDILINAGYKYGKMNIITGKDFKIDGVNNTVEEVYDKLNIQTTKTLVTNHNHWNDKYRDKAKSIINDAIKKGFTSSEQLFNRLILKSDQAKTNWQNILSDILSLNEKDYTFTKVNEIHDSILLPIFNEQEFHLENVWILVDVSSSMSDEQVTKAYSEIYKIINSFERVKLYVSFFSTFVTKPLKVKNVKTLKTAFNQMNSSGGTSFEIIFDYLNNHIKLPIAIVIITDGMATFPEKERSKSIPVFWAINNNYRKPSFGHLIRV